SSNSETVTVVWSFANRQAQAFIAGPRYFESHWLTTLQKSLPDADINLGVPSAALPAVAQKRTAAETGLPWNLIVAPLPGGRDPQDVIARRRNLSLGLAVMLLLIAAGSYFIWRAMNREMTVARLQSDFVSAVSHEFRTPLTTLRQFNEMLAEDDGP